MGLPRRAANARLVEAIDVTLHAIAPTLPGLAQTVRVPVQRMAVLVLVASVFGPTATLDLSMVARPMFVVWVVARGGGGGGWVDLAVELWP